MKFFCGQEFSGEVLCEVGLARLAGLGRHVAGSTSLPLEILLTTTNQEARLTTCKIQTAAGGMSAG